MKEIAVSGGGYARAPFIDAQAPQRVDGGEARNAAASSNDRARVASFTRNAGRRTTSGTVPAPPRYYMVLTDERFSTRNPLEKLSAPHSAIDCLYRTRSTRSTRPVSRYIALFLIQNRIVQDYAMTLKWYAKRPKTLCNGCKF
ncbi:unnamed protein product [Danaus chrysippus]|uniref:(African queen) hypothetical protein n=1 Tax=Danaus chrysippus TaxID=151541 RepID=A0A8J2MFJ1_9NEOP|nr:unnamed protein product [Danaus chrysippus]